MIARLVGFLLIGLAFLAGSAEAVMALGTGGHDTIATGEVWTLLSGESPIGSSGVWGMIQSILAATPAWIVMLVLGLALVFVRPKQKRKVLFRTTPSRITRR